MIVIETLFGEFPNNYSTNRNETNFRNSQDRSKEEEDKEGMGIACTTRYYVCICSYSILEL